MADSSRQSGAFGLLPITEDFNLEPPETALDDTDEKQRRQLSRTKKWKEQKAYLMQRRELYTKQVPGGALYKHMTKDDQAFYGAVGNAVIEEIDGWINSLEAN